MLCDLRRLRLLPGADPIEQLSDEAKRVDLIVVLTGRKTQKLGPQVGKPGGALPYIKAEHRHAAAHRLRPHRLVAPAHELLPAGAGLPLDGAPLKKRPHPRNDLPLLLGP